MSKISTFINLVKNDKSKIKIALFDNLVRTGILNWLSDRTFLKIAYRINMGKTLDLSDPKTFNEKLQWLKLNNRDPLYVKLVDKYDVKDFISKTIGYEYVIPTYGVWNTVEEIDFEKLPEQFVLKCTHDSGSIVICKDKKNFDTKKACSILKRGLNRNLYFYGREWPYKNVKPRIIAEKYMEDTKTGELRDYKFFCFNGEVKAMFIATERQAKTSTKFDFYDLNFNHLDIINGHPNSNEIIEKPQNFDLMVNLSSQLSKNIPHVRVDFYEVEGKVYFGEMTFSHYSGFTPFEPEEWDYIFGEWINI